jgi:hypothetical protein
LLSWAFALLVAAIALRLAISLLVSIAPELIGVSIALGVAYGAHVIYEFRRSRWWLLATPVGDGKNACYGVKTNKSIDNI